MLKLLKSGQQEAVEATERIMEDHSNEGLRCLVVAQKTLEPQACLPHPHPNPNPNPGVPGVVHRVPQGAVRHR